ncbi:hypothetical protein MITS9509_02485 [Synechococcus sp. MIT S9509]|uniref:hypothetical protein n=1 Tax=unclassified Synechococcus TaxID=2626047 RepID=UPI0007BB1390|nr:MULTISPECIES: hypothetical protein [unclassified Synechococcus]KZR85210.1 hypothetical protein MITS9504_02415 [Synechococcus sp. MIT S9504]KZR91257.1 hypothetical protein MITS9509_02485 [Synechococcus sp. MIT S9509]
MNSEPAEAVPREELDGRQMMTPGDRVILTTEGERHLGYIRPIAGMVTRTWMGFDAETYRVRLDQVTLRNPRVTWGIHGSSSWGVRCCWQRRGTRLTPG